MEYPFAILGGVMLVHIAWSGYCCWRAKKAYLAAERLYAWVQAAHDPLVCVVALNPSCAPGAGGPGWPPPEVGDFPPAA